MLLRFYKNGIAGDQVPKKSRKLRLNERGIKGME